MNNRFNSSKKKSKFSNLLSIFLPLAFFIVLGGLFYQGILAIDQTANNERLKAAQNAVTKAAVQCYALEGQYPPSIIYLQENYGLSVDEKKYIIDYAIFATNIMPEISVMLRDF